MSFYANQVVYNLDTKKPCLVSRAKSHRFTHLIDGEYKIALPKSVCDARKLLKIGRIQPSPIPATHCHKCMNWIENHKADGSCWK